MGNHFDVLVRVPEREKFLRKFKTGTWAEREAKNVPEKRARQKGVGTNPSDSISIPPTGEVIRWGWPGG